jgi:hypothetical protein
VRLSSEVMAQHKEEAPSSGWGLSEDGALVAEHIKIGPFQLNGTLTTQSPSPRLRRGL